MKEKEKTPRRIFTTEQKFKIKRDIEHQATLAVSLFLGKFNAAAAFCPYVPV